ncbi:MAG: hypothetical protein ACOYIP_02020 [Coriobacteriales bacterium]|jgi:hypothetical protein
MGNKDGIIIRFEHSNEQELGRIIKVVGVIKARYLIDIISYLDLEANPRNSKTGPVTNAIQESIATGPELFPFKTKGILLAASQYECLERKRYRIEIVNPELEGILDGGHNTLAVGLYILSHALEFAGSSLPTGSMNWDEFKELWDKNTDLINDYVAHTKHDDHNDDFGSLDFYIPIELLLPKDPDDHACVEMFNNNLLDINAARNNNVQLTVGTVANQRGYFDSLKVIMQHHDPDLYERIEWKVNDGGTIKIENIISLAWIPLSLLDPVRDSSGKLVEPPAAKNIYSGKAQSLKSFERFMSSPEVSLDSTLDNYKTELKNPSVVSAFEIAVQLPELYDYIYEKLPSLWNKSDGNYRNITAVRKLNNSRKVLETPFLKRTIETISPDGYVAPLVYGLRALMGLEYENGYPVVRWKKDPHVFLEDNLLAIVRRYKDVFDPWDWDPQKIGKAISSYNQVEDSYKMALAGIL